MERTIIAIEEQPIKWIKLGGGSIRLPGQIIKPGQKFSAKPSDIPKGFRDVVKPLEPIPYVIPEPGAKKKTEPPVQQVKVTEAIYKVQPRANSKTWFDVVDAQGKKLNEKALTKEIAENLVTDLLK